MKTIFHFLLFILTLPCSIQPEDAPQPLSVVIIGAGPAGLGAAIELKSTGAQVTLIEKREARSRTQTLFLFDHSLKLLDKWQVKPTEMKVINLQDVRMGLVRLNNLEEGLEKRVNELGIRILSGEFLRFQEKDAKSIVLSQQGKEVNQAYDIVVGADGAHSLVRDQLGIKSTLMGNVQGRSFMILSESQEAINITDPIRKNGFFVRKFSFPGKSLFFTQRVPGPQENVPISEQELIELMNACDFKNEAELMKENKVQFSNCFEVMLQQAKTFSDEKKGAILIGDAAAVASYFQGMSANTAFKEVELAGAFLEKVKKRDSDAYSFFNHKMKETTDELIQDSQFLFSPETDK